MVFSLADALLVAGAGALGGGAFGLWVGFLIFRAPRESIFLPNAGGQRGTSPLGKIGDTPPRPTPRPEPPYAPGYGPGRIPGRPGQQIDSAGGALPFLPRLGPDEEE